MRLTEFFRNPDKQSHDVVNLRFVAEQVVKKLERDGNIFPPDIIEIMIREAREGIKTAMSDAVSRERQK